MRSKRCSLFLLCCSLLCAFSVHGAAQTFTTLYSFSDVSYAAGSAPQGPLVNGVSGVLYGSTSEGGAYNQSGCSPNGGCGTIFSLTPPASQGGAWTESVLWSFGGTGDGISPFGSMAIGEEGVLYGATESGGANGQGTVFSLTPPASQGGAWTESVLWSFGGTGDGSGPVGGVIIGSSGVLYGTTPGGGANGQGTVFSLTPPASQGGAWTESVLWSFGEAGDGGQPYQGLVADHSSGVLYGTNGFIFSLSPPASSGGPWTEAILYKLKPGEDGHPVPLTIGKRGVLYGATSGNDRTNGGTIFSLKPPASQGGAWTEKTLWTFPATRTHARDGESPTGPLLFVKSTGTLYGTTQGGGTGKPVGSGTVFELSPPASRARSWKISILHSLYPMQGVAPLGGLIMLNGALYGVTPGGGSDAGGTVFSVVP